MIWRRKTYDKIKRLGIVTGQCSRANTLVIGRPRRMDLSAVHKTILVLSCSLLMASAVPVVVWMFPGFRRGPVQIQRQMRVLREYEQS